MTMSRYHLKARYRRNAMTMTPASLLQELNLARRACWKISQMTRIFKNNLSMERAKKNGAEQFVFENNNNLTCDFVNKLKLRQFRKNAYSHACNMFKKCSEYLLFLYTCIVLWLFPSTSSHLSNKTNKMLAAKIVWFTQITKKLKIYIVNHEKKRNAYLLKYTLFFVILLCCAGNNEARPNGTTLAGAVPVSQIQSPSAAIQKPKPAVSTDTNAIESSFVAGSQNAGEHFGTSSGVSLTSDSHISDETSGLNRRALVSDSDSESSTAEIRHDHEIKSYPVSQVDFQRVRIPFLIGIWILSASVAKIGFHMTPKLHTMFPESCLLIVVGVIIGFILHFSTSDLETLTPNVFFFYMLPPIILDAGYFMPNRLFFDNLGTILLMAVVGTIFNIVTIGASLWAVGLTSLYNCEVKLLDAFLFSSVISAVDPVAVLAVFEEIHVNEILYIVVFGESLLNDAVTVVLYHMMETYNEIGMQNLTPVDLVSGVASFFVVALGGTIIGVIWGFLTGLVTRFTDHVRVIEPIFIFVMAYLAYLNAEIFHMSGILAITFCGITMKNYVESNISQKSHTTVKYALKMLSSSSETIIFMFLGVSTVNSYHSWDTWFVLMTILFCSFYRVIGVILLTALANRFRLHKLSNVDQFVMSYGGLRGAVAFALVLLIDENSSNVRQMFITTTIAVIYFTVFLQGITIKPLVKFLNVKRASKRKPTMNERIHERFMDHLMAGMEDIIGKTGNYNVRDKFKRFDNRFIRPYLIRDLKGAEPKIIETYSKLTMRDAMEVMRRNPSTIGQMSGTESMSALFRNYTTSYLGGSPSFSNLETCSRNLDMHELDYNPSKKDLTDAKIHHLLAEELKPYKRHRRLSYSRHAVDDRDLSTQVNYKMHMNIRRMVKDGKHHKRSKRGGNKESVKQNHVSFNDFQENGSSKQFSHEYINEVLHESAEENPNLSGGNGGQHNPDDWDEDGLTFTAKSSPDSDRANNNSLIAHITSLPGFDSSKARIVKHYASSGSGGSVNNSFGASPNRIISPEDIGPTAAELILPWRRDRSYQSFLVGGEHAVILEEEIRHPISHDSFDERRVATPTAIESQLPWKRNDEYDGEDGGAVQQNEFPSWASNKEYLAYNSPSATFLGGLSKPKQVRSVIGLFRRESSGSGSVAGGGDTIGSDPSLANSPGALGAAIGRAADRRSASIAGPPLSDNYSTHAGPFPVTASHRRNTRRGSMLELSGDTIPEENGSNPAKRLIREREKRNSESRVTGRNGTDDESIPMSSPFIGRANSVSSGGGGGGTGGFSGPRLIRGLSTGTNGREPLLPKLTPRAQIRRMNHVTTALLSSSVSTSDSDEDDDEEDICVYDEDITVTTRRNGRNTNSSEFGEGGDIVRT